MLAKLRKSELMLRIFLIFAGSCVLLPAAISIPWLPLLLQKFNIHGYSNFSIRLIAILPRTAIMFFAIPAGKLIDKFGHRKVLLLSLPIPIISGILQYFCAAGSMLYPILLLRFISGIGYAVVIVTAYSLMSSLYKGKDASKIFMMSILFNYIAFNREISIATVDNIKNINFPFLIEPCFILICAILFFCSKLFDKDLVPKNISHKRTFKKSEIGFIGYFSYFIFSLIASIVGLCFGQIALSIGRNQAFIESSFNSAFIGSIVISIFVIVIMKEMKMPYIVGAFGFLLGGLGIYTMTNELFNSLRYGLVIYSIGEPLIISGIRIMVARRIKEDSGYVSGMTSTMSYAGDTMSIFFIQLVMSYSTKLVTNYQIISFICIIMAFMLPIYAKRNRKSSI